MPLLSNETLRATHSLIIGSGIYVNRRALLSLIPPEIVAGLVTSPTPSAQLLLDLEGLNSVGRLDDGSVPLLTLVDNALELIRDAFTSELLKKVRQTLLSSMAGAGMAITPDLAGATLRQAVSPSTRTSMSHGVEVDFVLVTAMDQERDALLSKWPQHRRLPADGRDVRVYYSGSIAAASLGHASRNYSVVLMPLLDVDRAHTATAVSDAIRRWKPRYVILSGLGTGVPTKVSVGDVVVAAQTVDYEIQERTPRKKRVYWQVHRADPVLLAAATAMKDDEWHAFLDPARALQEAAPARRHVGVVASGDKLLTVRKAITEIQRHWPSLVGVDTGAAGAACACSEASRRTGFLTIRGISALVGREPTSPRGDEHSAACDAAAAYVISLIKSGIVSPAYIISGVEDADAAES